MTPTPDWQGDNLDLGAYVARLGIREQTGATVETLRRVHDAHVRAFPFENIDSVLGRPANLDIAALQERLLGGRRGDSCSGQTTIFAAALDRLGFTFTALSARVADPDWLAPATHGLICIRLADDSLWISDVGFGDCPIEPIPLVEGGVFEQPTATYRLTRRPTELGTTEWVLLAHKRSEWVEQYAFSLDPRYLPDLLVTNYFVSTNAASPFRGRLLAVRTTDSERRILTGTTLSVRTYDGVRSKQQFTPAELPSMLSERFDIDLDVDDAAALLERMTPS